MFLSLIIISCFFYLPGRLCTSIWLLFAFTCMLLHNIYREKKNTEECGHQNAKFDRVILCVPHALVHN